VWQRSDGSTRNNLGTLGLGDASHTDRTFGIRSLTPSLYSPHITCRREVPKLEIERACPSALPSACPSARPRPPGLGTPRLTSHAFISSSETVPWKRMGRACGTRLVIGLIIKHSGCDAAGGHTLNNHRGVHAVCNLQIYS
jgi:hypothetical protein